MFTEQTYTTRKQRNWGDIVFKVCVVFIILLIILAILGIIPFIIFGWFYPKSSSPAPAPAVLLPNEIPFNSNTGGSIYQFPQNSILSQSQCNCDLQQSIEVGSLRISGNDAYILDPDYLQSGISLKIRKGSVEISEKLYASNILTNMLITQDTYQPSDSKLKTNILNLNNNFANYLIDGLRPVSFEYKNNSSNKTHVGFIAQEILELLNHSVYLDSIVKFDTNNDYYIINQISLIPFMIEYMKETRKLLNDLYEFQLKNEHIISNLFEN